MAKVCQTTQRNNGSSCTSSSTWDEKRSTICGMVVFASSAACIVSRRFQSLTDSFGTPFWCATLLLINAGRSNKKKDNSMFVEVNSGFRCEVGGVFVCCRFVYLRVILRVYVECSKSRNTWFDNIPFKRSTRTKETALSNFSRDLEFVSSWSIDLDWRKSVGVRVSDNRKWFTVPFVAVLVIVLDRTSTKFAEVNDKLLEVFSVWLGNVI